MSIFMKIRVFLSEVKAETKKVTWPKLSELKESTTVVIITVFLITAFIAVIDLILSTGINFVLALGT